MKDNEASMRFKQWLEVVHDPKSPNPNTEFTTKRYYAILLDDGKIIYYPDAERHADVLLRAKVPYHKISATGWFDWSGFHAKPWGDPFQFGVYKKKK